MSDIFKRLFDFIFLETKSMSRKIIYFLVAAGLLFFINDTFKITKNISINQKLGQLQKLKELSPSMFENDSLIKQEVLLVKDNMLNKATSATKIKNFIASQFDKIFTWRNFSASFFWLVAMILLPLMAFSSPQPFWTTVGIVILAEICFLILALIYIRILGQIPAFKHIWLNHALNYLAQLATSGVVIYISGFPKKKKLDQEKTDS
jgi:hypothetical protein